MRWGQNGTLQAGLTPVPGWSGVPRPVYGQSAQRILTSARFLSPTRNLSCELTDRPGRISVYCQSLNRAHSVKMDAAGRLRICRGARCLGNPAQGTPTLGYGSRTTVGRFECRSQFNTVRCTIARTGRGFLIDKAGERRVG